MKPLKLDTENIKRVGINLLVDAASIVFITASLYSASLAGYTLYASYYKALTLPTPEAFSAASLQLSTAISFVFAVFFTRKYRKDGKKDGFSVERKT
jgi:hypothetical protein